MEIVCRSGPGFAVVRDSQGQLHTVWICPAGCTVIELYYEATTEELILDPCPRCGQELSAAEFSHTLQRLMEQMSSVSVRPVYEGGDTEKDSIEVAFRPLLLTGPEQYQPTTLRQENAMDNINGSGTTIETDTPGADERATIVKTISHSVRDTLCDRAFLIGTAVGAVLAVVGVRVVQAYLAQEESSDEPF